MSEKPVRAVRLSIGRLGAGRHSMSTARGRRAGSEAHRRRLFPLPQPVPIADRGFLRDTGRKRVPGRAHPGRAGTAGLLTGGTRADQHGQQAPDGAKIESAIAAAYAGIANTGEVLILINHFPMENVGWQLQSDKPEIVAAIAQING